MARQTSAATYQQVVSSGLVGARQREVYGIIFEHGPMTAGEVYAMIPDRPNATYQRQSGRLTELRDMGLIQECGTTTCRISGRTVILWDVTGRGPTPRPKRPKIPPMPTRLALDTLDVLDDLDALDRLPADLAPLRDWIKENYLP